MVIEKSYQITWIQKYAGEYIEITPECGYHHDVYGSDIIMAQSKRHAMKQLRSTRGKDVIIRLCVQL